MKEEMMEIKGDDWNVSNNDDNNQILSGKKK